jgi:hypothetical protein
MKWIQTAMKNPLTRNHLLSLVGAPAIWAAHFLISYLLVSFACAFGFNGAHVGLGIATLLALALLGYAGLLNFRKWQRSRSDGKQALSAFFALTAMMLCGLSALSLVWVAFPAVLLPTCAA